MHIKIPPQKVILNRVLGYVASELNFIKYNYNYIKDSRLIYWKPLSETPLSHIWIELENFPQLQSQKHDNNRINRTENTFGVVRYFMTAKKVLIVKKYFMISWRAVDMLFAQKFSVDVASSTARAVPVFAIFVKTT